jgi:hypothetical protein
LKTNSRKALYSTTLENQIPIAKEKKKNNATQKVKYVKRAREISGFHQQRTENPKRQN